jgi:uncharacterized protein (DUF488 family)
VTKGGSTAVRVFTIGHSNRPLDLFLTLLQEHEIGAVADVRRYPSSRKYPHFNQDALRASLGALDIRYVWFEALGGRRHGPLAQDSPNRGLTSPGFRNYADYMLTAAFQDACADLLSLCAEVPTALMCAERFYWKCHRRLLSDSLTAHGATVLHILEQGELRPHKITPGAVIRTNEGVVYP